jgi:hypothetical protein
METIHEAAMLEASALTTRQLEEAINIVEAEFGADPDGKYSGVITALLSTLARNYGMRLAAGGR